MTFEDAIAGHERHSQLLEEKLAAKSLRMDLNILSERHGKVHRETLLKLVVDFLPPDLCEVPTERLREAKLLPVL